MRLDVSYHPPTPLRVRFSLQNLDVSTGIPVARDFVERDPYEGDYEITPTQSTQILTTNGKRMTDNVTINPIPSNYGLITWDGLTLTVS